MKTKKTIIQVSIFLIGFVSSFIQIQKVYEGTAIWIDYIFLVLGIITAAHSLNKLDKLHNLDI